jgi:hypothetical protein
MSTNPPALRIRALGLLFLAPLAGALLLIASACDTSPRPAPAIQAESPGAAPSVAALPLSAGPVMGAESPSTYATVRPPDGPFEERTPPEGPPRSATMRESALVPHEELFKRYGKELGLGPKDEMRHWRTQNKTFSGNTVIRYRQFHDGYETTGGYVLNAKDDGLVRWVAGDLVLGLPDAPEILVTKERAMEIAKAEFTREKRLGQAEVARIEVYPTMETLWTLRIDRNKRVQRDHELVHRCHVEHLGIPYSVDMNATTGELRTIFCEWADCPQE